MSDAFDETPEPEAEPEAESTSWAMPEDEVLEHAHDIVRRFKKMSLTLTLRQIYYQFVKGGLAPSSGKVYDRIGRILTKARYDGTFPIEDIEDRGREVRKGKFTERLVDVDSALERAERTIKWMPQWLIQTDRWVGQPKHVSVWIEKDALANVIERPCDELGVAWFPCKGYPSVSALWGWLKAAKLVSDTAAQRRTPIQEFVVLYCGDYDPDGLEIPKSALRNLRKLMEVKGWRLKITFKRIALNRDQIDLYDPPPFEAKMTSARYRKYVEETGTDSAWELDALDPPVLQALIREHVAPLFDEGVHGANQELVQSRRQELVDRMADEEWMRSVLSTEDKAPEDDEEEDDGSEETDEEFAADLNREECLRILDSIGVLPDEDTALEDLRDMVVVNLQDGTLVRDDLYDFLDDAPEDE